jgi:hypothetical protein
MNIFSRQSGLFALALLLVGCLIAAKLPTGGKQYDYVMVERQPTRLYISEGNEKYAEQKLEKADVKDFYHHQGPLFKVVNEFEAQGYEVYSTYTMGYSVSAVNGQVSTVPATYVLLRRPR